MKLSSLFSIFANNNSYVLHDNTNDKKYANNNANGKGKNHVQV